MADVVVTVPSDQYNAWLREGDLPGMPWSGYTSHFWLLRLPRNIEVGDRVYVVAKRRLRGYAPLTGVERECRLLPGARPHPGCLMREGGAVAVTIDEHITGFRGFRYVWWDRSAERPYTQPQTLE